jgi:hypothetical protein
MLLAAQLVSATDFAFVEKTEKGKTQHSKR